MMIIAFSNFCEVHGPSIISCSQGFQINQFYKLEKIIHENSNKNSTKNTCSGCSLIVPQQQPQSPTEKSDDHSGFQQTQINMDMNFEQNQLNNQYSNANDIQKRLDMENDNEMAIDEEEDNPIQINIKNGSKGINNSVKGNQQNETQKANNRYSINKLNSNSAINENDVGFKGFISDDIENNMTYITTRYPYLSRLYPIVRQACVRSLSCEFCPGREGAIFFGDEQNGYSLSYIFKLKDIQARGFQRWYSISFLHSDKSFIIASWGFLVSKFKATAKDLQQNAEKMFEYEKRANQEVNINRVKVYSPLSPEQFIRRRGNQPLRSLVDLLNNPNVFMQLHSTFAWILRASSDRLYEKRQENYDMMDSVLHMKYNELSYNGNDQNDKENVLLLDQEGMTININGTNQQNEVIEKPVDSKPVMIENLKDLWRIFGEMHFKYLIYNTAIGTQIIIRTDKVEIATSIIKVLKSFIPESCCTSYDYLDEYIEPWRCNMLGIKKEVEIPSEIDESNYVLIDISTEENTNEIINIQFKPVIDQLQTNYPFQKSVLIDQIEQIVNSDIPSKVFDIQMFVFREKWLNKAKLFFKFIKLGKTETENKQDSVINVLNVNRSDIPIMLYFSRGLGKNDRQILLRD